MSNSKQIVFGVVGVIFCVVAAGIMTGIRNTGSWTEFRDALAPKPVPTLTPRAQPQDPTIPTPAALSYANTNLNPAFKELLAYAWDQELTAHELIYEENWPLEIKQLRPNAVRFIELPDQYQSKGIFFILDRHKDHELGVLRWEDVRPAAVHPESNSPVKETPHGGFRNLPQTNLSWHWHKP